MGCCSILTSFFAQKNTWTFVGFSVVVSEPFLGWTEIMEFRLVTEIPAESTEKLKDTVNTWVRFLGCEWADFTPRACCISGPAQRLCSEVSSAIVLGDLLSLVRIHPAWGCCLRPRWLSLHPRLGDAPVGLLYPTGSLNTRAAPTRFSLCCIFPSPPCLSSSETECGTRVEDQQQRSQDI